MHQPRPAALAVVALLFLSACTAPTSPASSTAPKVVGASPKASPAAKERVPTATDLAGSWFKAPSGAAPGPERVAACMGSSRETIRLTQDGSRVTYDFNRRYEGGAPPPPDMVTDFTERAEGDLVDGAVALQAAAFRRPVLSAGRA